MYSALQSITKNWKEPNMWVYDTSVYPFKVSLRRMSNEITSRLHSGYNLLELSVEDEYLAMANRYYALGSREGSTRSICSMRKTWNRKQKRRISITM